MKLGIIGCGVLGNALFNVFTEKGIKCLVSDKYQEEMLLSKYGHKIDIVFSKEKDRLLDCQIIFLCLPTPYDDKIKGYITSAFEEWLLYFNHKDFKGIIVNKSTVMIGFHHQMAEKYPQLELIHNPEFLSARSAIEDFRNQKQIILGVPKKNSILDIPPIDRVFQTIKGTQASAKVYNFFHQYFPESEIKVCTTKESEAMKLFCNSFYAMKLQIFNEFYQLCQLNSNESTEEGMDYNVIKDLMLGNGWINPMHTNVPGPDGKLSYGGGCFPKDTQALLGYMERMECHRNMLQSCIVERNKMRNEN